jgi:hypothetical protein
MISPAPAAAAGELSPGGDGFRDEPPAIALLRPGGLDWSLNESYQ